MVQTLQSSSPLLNALRDRAGTIDEMILLLRHYGLLPQLLREVLIDQEIAGIQLTSEETLQACQQFYQQQQLKSEADVQAWLAEKNLSREQLEPVITRTVRLERYKQETWGNKLEPYFLERKTQLDRVIYSLIRVKDLGTAQELYFRIQEGEESFEKLAREHSLGVEAETGGLLGPVELGVPHPVIAKLLLTSKPGQLIPPARLNEWFIILRLEKFFPAQLDAAMQQRLLNELFENWLKEETAKALASANSASLAASSN
ncbi:parvulin-like peptidyl-prolyl isomerase [Leptolyngbyaceae cyanobacterium JSC-12]|nr:parvulin-like peptidyl-prolyl isomerase [Leptolyngbyaceae cyanobacterium JSC-12]